MVGRGVSSTTERSVVGPIKTSSPSQRHREVGTSMLRRVLRGGKKSARTHPHDHRHYTATLEL